MTSRAFEWMRNWETAPNDPPFHLKAICQSFFVKMQFGRGDVAVGEGVSGCVYINEQLNECGWATNSDDMR